MSAPPSTVLARNVLTQFFNIHYKGIHLNNYLFVKELLIISGNYVRSIPVTRIPPLHSLVGSCNWLQTLHDSSSHWMLPGHFHRCSHFALPKYCTFLPLCDPFVTMVVLGSPKVCSQNNWRHFQVCIQIGILPLCTFWTCCPFSRERLEIKGHDWYLSWNILSKFPSHL